MSWYIICVLKLGLKEFLSRNICLISVKFAFNGGGGVLSKAQSIKGSGFLKRSPETQQG